MQCASYRTPLLPPGVTIPEMRQVVEHGLLVELVLALVDDDRAVHKVVSKVGSPFHIQGQIPVNPPRDKAVKTL